MIRAALATLALMGAPAIAQEAPANVCYAGGVQFSPGATFRAGNSVMKCSPELTWEETTDWSMGCINDGRVHGPGVETQEFAASSPYVCELDGTWKKVEPES